jgi:hypothetical protein
MMRTSSTPTLTTMTHPEPSLTRPVTVEVPTAVAQKLAEWHEGTLEHAALTALRLYHGIGPTSHAQLLQAAAALDTSPSKALRTAIGLLSDQSTKLKPPAVRGRPITNQERDTAIFLRAKEGETHATIGRAFNLSLVRVGQILAHQRALRGITPSRVNHTRSLTPTVWPTTAEEQQNLADYRERSDLSAVLLHMDTEGMTPATAAEATGLTVEQVKTAYAAYKAALPPSPTKGDKAAATFAGIHALEAKPDTPQGEEVSTLKEAPPPARRLAVIPPSMRAKMEAEANPLPPLPADPTPGVSAVDFMDAFMKGEDVL